MLRKEGAIRNELQQKITVSVLVVLPLIATLAAIALLWNRYVFWDDIMLLIVGYVFTMIGVGIGYHRMLTHGGFKAPAPVRAFFLMLGAMSFEGPPLMWAATHIRHHAHSDEEGDPHSPLEGFWHSHMGWLFSPKNFEDAKKYAPHLLQDPVVVWVDRWTYVLMGLSLLIPFLLGGFTGLIWGGGVRIFLMTHVGWSVNSICHTFGKQPFEANDESRNEWIIGLLACGEGWHNNHHAFPRSAFHGLRWWQFDLSGYIIRLMEKARLVTDVQRVTPELIEAKAIKTQNIRDTFTELKLQLTDAVSAAQEEVERLLQDSQVGIPHPEPLKRVHDESIKQLEKLKIRIIKMQRFRKERIEESKEEIAGLVEMAKRKMQKEANKINPTRV